MTDPRHSADEVDLWRRFQTAGTGRPAGDCPAELELAGYVDGRLSPEQAQSVSAHLAECPDCRQAVEEVRELLAADPVLPPAEIIAQAKALVPRTRRGPPDRQ